MPLLLRTLPAAPALLPELGSWFRTLGKSLQAAGTLSEVRTAHAPTARPPTVLCRGAPTFHNGSLPPSHPTGVLHLPASREEGGGVTNSFFFMVIEGTEH